MSVDTFTETIIAISVILFVGLVLFMAVRCGNEDKEKTKETIQGGEGMSERNTILEKAKEAILCDNLKVIFNGKSIPGVTRISVNYSTSDQKYTGKLYLYNKEFVERLLESKAGKLTVIEVRPGLFERTIIEEINIKFYDYWILEAHTGDPCATFEVDFEEEQSND